MIIDRLRKRIFNPYFQVIQMPEIEIHQNQRFKIFALTVSGN
jgi:hypothetical protein